MLSLQRLAIESSAHQMLLPECMSMLSSLKHLHLSSSDNGKLNIQFDLSGLVSLKNFWCSGAVTFSTGLCALVGSSQLKVVSILNMQQCHQVTTEQLMRVVHLLGRKRPEVELHTSCFLPE